MKIYALLVFLLLSCISFSQETFDVFFDFNIDTPNIRSVKRLIEWIPENQPIKVVKIYGYCDSVDDKRYNKELSVKRIQSVLKILRNNKVNISKNLEMVPYGKDFKLSKNQNENRKVTLFYEALEPFKIDGSSEKEMPQQVDLEATILNEKNTLAKKFEEAAVGDKIRIDHIYFYLNSDKIVKNSLPILEELYTILMKYPNLKIELHGHICCNADTNSLMLSKKRAQSIYTFLVNKGILFFRVLHQGFGSTKPVYAIPEKNNAEKLSNRRVEVLILNK